MNKNIAKKLDVYRQHEEYARRINLPFLFEDGRVVSFPRSGRSWIKFMTIHVMLNAKARYKKYQGLAMFKHDGAGIHIGNPKKYFKEDKLELYGNNRVALIVRHPLDVCISGWHLLSGRMKQSRIMKLSLSEYVKSKERGLPFLIEWMNAWANQRSVPKDFRIFYYEDFVTDTVAQLEEFCSYLGLKDQPRERLERAVTDFSFDNMRSHDYFYLLPGIEREIRQALDPSDPRSYAVRRGEINGWKTDIDFEDDVRDWAVDYFNEHIDPFFDRYKKQ